MTCTSRKSRHLANHAAYVREHVMIDGDVRVNLIGTAENPANFAEAPPDGNTLPSIWLQHDIERPLINLSDLHQAGAIELRQDHFTIRLPEAMLPGASQHKALIRATATNGYIPKSISTTRATADLLGKLLKSSFPSRTHVIYEQRLFIGIDTRGHISLHQIR
ncbi:hypothetical protein T492DRAFT_872259 [Pavlovales sp. CCMP2436]|nr:hypothetical protein T492DRAFT_872259 [Pavlovales sp. CCMP2436]